MLRNSHFVLDLMIRFILQLPLGDQTVLLEEAWPELFLLSAAQWGLSIDDGMKTRRLTKSRLFFKKVLVCILIIKFHVLKQLHW
jgi:hypothetical protein